MANNSSSVRVRFAPSPTGPLHIGGVRTALFNYLFARKSKGTFIIRIEDTDRSRIVKGAEKHIFDSLSWLGIQADETVGVNELNPPYRQSERLAIYKKEIEQLIEKELVYYAFDSEEEISQARKERNDKGEGFLYNNLNRLSFKNSLSLSKEEVQKKLFQGEKYVVRLKLPANEEIIANDIIRGTIRVNTNTMDDKILFKSDGFPTYHFANVVDDYLMKISHIIRGEEWLPSLPLHIQLYKYLGWTPPKFAHLPLILNPNGKGKLSKRMSKEYDFPVFVKSFDSDNKGFIESGFLPESLFNSLALIGWNNKDDKETYTREELIACFDLENISSSGARYDIEKMKWINQKHILNKSGKELAVYLIKKDKNYEKIKGLPKIIDKVKERAILLTDLERLISYFIYPPKEYIHKNIDTLKEKIDLEKLLTMIESQKSNFDNASKLSEKIKEQIAKDNLPMGAVMQNLRMSLVGKMEGIDLAEIMTLIGFGETIKRLKKYIN